MPSAIRAALLSLCLLALGACSDNSTAVTDITSGMPVYAVADVAALGALAFADQNLSINRNQSCQTCHEPSEGFASSLNTVPNRGGAVEGSITGEFGARKPPTAAYATLTPLFTSGGGGTGGLFWDGRATGATLGAPAADQALGPFLNPVEQALPDKACVVYRVREGYGAAYRAAWGNEIDLIVFPTDVETVCATAVSTPGEYVTLSTTDRTRVVNAYNNIALAIAEFENTFNLFNSRGDLGQLTALEQEGQKLFGGKAKCQQCHTNKGARAAFTDFKFHNLGVPRNPENIAFNYATMAFDPGLGGVTGVTTQLGKFRTPTVRNVGKGANRSYMHNGVLKSLKQVVDFYNTRDALRTCTTEELTVLHPSQYGNYDPDGAGPLTAAKCWPPAEYSRNMDTRQMGNLGLTDAQVDAIVAYMRAMSDN